MKSVIYLLQVTACTGVFYTFYFLLLRRYTFFTLNRWYLMGTLLLSFLIPAITIPVKHVPQTPVIYVQQMQVIAEPVPAGVKYQADDAPSINWLQAGKLVYITLAAACFIRLLYILFLFVHRTQSQKLMQIGKVQVLRSSGSFGNSSFFNVVFINDADLSLEEVRQILAHELLHVKLWHSVDRLIARLIQIVLWFNPFVYAYMRSIEENHEFEVDSLAAGDTNKSSYATLLFKLSVSNQSSLFQSFSKAPLKKRVAMLFNQPTNHMKKIMYVLVLPVVVLSCLAFGKFKNDGHQKRRLSAVGDLSHMGAHPLVIIDGKEYSDEILYTISDSCIAGMETWKPSLNNKAYGAKAKDGLIDITTEHHKIVYMTAVEKENLEKLAAAPQNQFFIKVRLKNNSGGVFEKAITSVPNKGGWASSDVKLTDKIVFIVDGRLYPESEVKQVERYAKTHKIKAIGTGEVKSNQSLISASLSGYDVYFTLSTKTDTAGLNKYKQIDRLRGKYGRENKKWGGVQNYSLTEDYKRKEAISRKVAGKIVKYKVLAAVDSLYGKEPFGHIKGYQLLYDNDTYLLDTRSGHLASLQGKLQSGDEIEVKMRGCLYGQDLPVIISPASISRNGVKLFELTKADTARNYAFLYEANRVRFTDGKITNIQRYANGKLKNAVVEVENGYKIRFNAKLSAPQFTGINEGDHVWFRFVHEVQTGAKEYMVNDWVALSNRLKSYGTKNPDFFFKYYEKI